MTTVGCNTEVEGQVGLVGKFYGYLPLSTEILIFRTFVELPGDFEAILFDFDSVFEHSG